MCSHERIQVTSHSQRQAPKYVTRHSQAVGVQRMLIIADDASFTCAEKLEGNAVGLHEYRRSIPVSGLV